MQTSIEIKNLSLWALAVCTEIYIGAKSEDEIRYLLVRDCLNLHVVHTVLVVHYLLCAHVSLYIFRLHITLMYAE
jgi:hypothetical protein